MKITILSIITAVLVGCATILSATQLIWSPDPATALVTTNFNVYTAPAGSSTFTLLATTSATNLNLGKAPFGQMYFVTAVSDQGEGDTSNVVTNRIPGAPFIKLSK